MRPIYILVLCASSAAAQTFQGLATTNDGATLYFSTPDRTIGSGQSFHSKIFRWDATLGFQLVADVPDPGVDDGCTTPNFYQLTSPQVSADGSILAYTATRPTSAGRYCTRSEPNQGVIVQKAVKQILTGSLTLSPDGHYAITTPADAVTDNYHIVTDVFSSTQTVVAGAFSGDRRRITDDGSVLSIEPTALLLTDRTGGTRLWQTKLPVDDAIVDRAGHTLVYLTRLGPYNPAAISVIDTSTGAETQIFSGFGPGNLNLTASGTQLLFTNSTGAGPQLYLLPITGGEPRLISALAISDAILSGDGAVVYAETTGSRLVRIDVATGAVTELAPATPLLTAVYRPYPPATTVAAVGSVLTLYGSGIPPTKQITLCNQLVEPIASSVNRFLQIQVPWNLPDQTCQAIVQTASPFETAVPLTVHQYDPQFIMSGDGSNALLIHGDFKAIIGPTAPAHPGEIIVTYMTGLGPVDHNGRLTKPGFSCLVGGIQANLPYVGIAPNYLGVYQLNIQVPDVAQSSASLICGWDDLTSAYADIWLGPN